MRKTIVNLVTFLCFGATSFVQPLVARAETPVHEIVGGEIVSDLQSFEYKHTVRLLVKAVLDGENVPDSLKGLKMSWRCSGALISKRVVLSAAHCFPRNIGLTDPNSGKLIRADLKNLSAEAFFKTDTKADRPWGIQSQSVLAHEGFREDWVSRVANVWNPSEAIHDIALVKLAEDAPADKSPVALLDNREAPLSEGEEAVMAGYGKDLSGDQIAIPRLRRVTVPVRQALRNNSEWYVGKGDFNNAGAVANPQGGCVGDSGGPLFVKREKGIRLAGVIVRGPDEPNGGCAAAVTIVTSVGSYNAWITSRLAAALDSEIDK